MCTYANGNFIAERDDNGLNIYLLGSEPLTNMVDDHAPSCGCGTRVGAGSSMDAGRTTAETIQRRSEEMRKSRVWG